MRSILITSSLDEGGIVTVGTEAVLNAELNGFRDEDRYTVQWQYSPDGGETILDAEGADGLNYHYTVNKQNFSYAWRLLLTLLPDEETAE